MINKTWLKISLVLPLLGITINELLISFYYMKNKDNAKNQEKINYIIAVLIPFAGLVAGVLVCELFYRGYSMMAGSEINIFIRLTISGVVTGTLMNLAFVMYYLKASSR
ncbi:MAG: hypothetical protein E7616_07640 [Ruminococcaceae bacterium]|nr:hypothetical protein [Oscillospiraceae bacterium]